MAPDGPECVRADRRRAAWAALAVALLTLLAFVERAVGIDARLPQAREADTALVHYAAYYDRPPGAAVNSATYPSSVYPVLLGQMLVVLPGSGYAVFQPPDAPLRAHLDAAANPYTRARWLIALLSLLAVPGTYLFARRWLERGWSVVAAAFTATSLLAFEMSVVGKPHGALLAFTALSLWTIVRLVDTGRLRDYCAAGIATAFAMATLNSGLFLFPALVLAHVLGLRADRHRGRWRGFGIALAICAALCIDSYWLVLVPPTGSTHVDGALNMGEQAIDWAAWNGGGFPDMLPVLSQHDPVLLALAGVGLLGGLFRLTWLSRAGSRLAQPRAIVAGKATHRVAANVVVGLFAGTWIFLFGLHEPFYARFALPLVPIAAVLAAAALRGVDRVVARLLAPTSDISGGARAPRWIGPVLAALALAFPCFVTFHMARIRAREDTTELAARWVVTNLGPDSGPVALDAMLTLPLFVRADVLAGWPRLTLQPWSRYQLDADLGAQVVGVGVEAAWDLHSILQRGMYTDHRLDRTEVLDRLRAIGARWVMVTIPTADEAASDDTRATVREIAGEPRATILPFGLGGTLDSIFTRDADPEFLNHLLAQDRLGPPIEVYALP